MKVFVSFCARALNSFHVLFGNIYIHFILYVSLYVIYSKFPETTDTTRSQSTPGSKVKKPSRIVLTAGFALSYYVTLFSNNIFYSLVVVFVFCFFCILVFRIMGNYAAPLISSNIPRHENYGPRQHFPVRGESRGNVILQLFLVNCIIMFYH